MISVLNVREIDRDIELAGSIPDLLLYCGRSSRFAKAQQLVPELIDCSFLGNQHPMNHESARDRVCDSFKVNVLWPAMKSNNGNRIKRGVHRLAERSRTEHIGLVCHCKPKRCHCDEIVKAVAWVNRKVPAQVEKPAPVPKWMLIEGTAPDVGYTDDEIISVYREAVAKCVDPSTFEYYMGLALCPEGLIEMDEVIHYCLTRPIAEPHIPIGPDDFEPASSLSEQEALDFHEECGDR